MEEWIDVIGLVLGCHVVVLGGIGLAVLPAREGVRFVGILVAVLVGFWVIARGLLLIPGYGEAVSFGFLVWLACGWVKGGRRGKWGRWV